MSAFQDLSIPEPVDGKLPRWVRENNYPERHQEMLDDLYMVGFWQEVCQLTLKNGGHRPEGVSPSQWLQTLLTEFPEDGELIRRELATAAARKAVVQADFLKGDFELVFYKALWSVNSRRLWAGGRQEYASLEEFLVDSISRFHEPGHEGELSDALFLMEHFLPIMQSVGGDFQPEKLLAFQEGWSRARKAVPYLRSKVRKLQNSSDEILKGTPEGKALEAEFQRAVDNAVNVVADSSIPRDGPTGISETLFGKDGNERPTPAQGYFALYPEKALFFFVVPAGWQSAIERRLGHLVAFETIDPEVGFQDLDRLLHPKGTKRTAEGK